MYIGVTNSSNIANTIHSTHIDIFGSRFIDDFFIVRALYIHNEFLLLHYSCYKKFQIYKNQIDMAPSIFNCDCLKAKQCPCDTQEAILG